MTCVIHYVINMMRRITIRLPEQQVATLEKLVAAGEFPTVSEAIRGAVRELIQQRAPDVLAESDKVTLSL